MQFQFEKVLILFFVVSPLHQCIQFPEIYSYYNVGMTKEDITECEIALEKFAQSSSNYTMCTLRNAHPIHMCQNCVNSYVSLLEDHDNILKLEVNGTKCKDKLLNLDRLQIVESTFINMKDLWERAFCNKCFEWTNKTIPTLSNETMTFIKYFTTTKNCINEHFREAKHTSNDTDQICIDCMEDYLTLNSYYESLKGYSETTGICMDIVDSMNATRSIWSGVLNCCKLRKTPEVAFLSCTALIAFLPALFYFATRIYSSETPKIQVIGHRHFEETIENVPGPSVTSINYS